MKKVKNGKYLAISCFSVLSFLAIWYLYTKVLGFVQPTSLPDPISVVKTFIYKLSNKAPDGATLMQHMYSSLRIALYGYVLSIVIGVPLGILMAWYKPVELLTRPIFDFIKAVPGLAWAPMMIILMGIGLTSKAVTVFISGMIPCVLNAYAGIKQTREVHLWVARTFGAGRRQMLFKVAIPTALPYIMTGVRVSLGACWMTIVAAEMVASSSGLGYMIQQCRGIYRPDVIIVLGALLNILLGYIERAIVKGRNYDK